MILTADRRGSLIFHVPTVLNARNMKTLYITGWTGNIIGLALWLYGYIGTGTAPFIDWPSISPDWISAFLPNRETEIGTLLMCLSVVPFLSVAMVQQSERSNDQP